MSAFDTLSNADLITTYGRLSPIHKRGHRKRDLLARGPFAPFKVKGPNLVSELDTGF
jgi:hypothetical protein